MGELRASLLEVAWTGSEESLIRKWKPRTALSITSREWTRVSTPVDLDCRPFDPEEYDDPANGNGCGKRGGSDVVVFTPPRDISPFDENIENVANRYSRPDVCHGEWGPAHESAEEDERNMDVFYGFEFLAQHEKRNREHGADKKEPEEAIVHAAGSEHTLGTKRSP